MKQMRSIVAALVLIELVGCAAKHQYGTEMPVYLPGKHRQVWAVAPALNLSGQEEVDPLLQADDVYEQLQQVHGLTVIPVNRVAQVYAALKLDKVQSSEQAALVCDALACDALVVPTVTAYDPYDPPKFGASLQLFRKPRGYGRAPDIDIRALASAASPPPVQSLPRQAGFKQSVGMYDAANGSVREALFEYARGRNDPLGPLGSREYLLSMDRYCGFVYHELIVDLLRKMRH